MSIKNELITLEGARRELQKQLEEISPILKELYAKKNPLVQKAETLSTRTSSLARNLLEKVQEELENVNKAIAQVESKQAKVKKEIKEKQQEISLRENNVDLYINEQSQIMISTFFEYMRTNFEKLGLETKKEFYIIGVNDYKEDRYSDYYVPTGNIGIYDSEENLIVSSNDFYFENCLYTIKRDEHYDNITRYETEWYKDYRNKFVSHLLETLEREYTFGEFFKLTIEDSHFTLELV